MAISGASPVWVIVATSIIVPTYFLRALRWKVLLIPIKDKIRFGNAYWCIALGFMINTFIPIRLGEFARAYVLGEREKLGFASCFSSIVIERTLDLIGLLTLGLSALFILPTDLSSPSWVLDGFKAVGALICLILVIIGLGIKKEEFILKILHNTMSSTPLLNKYNDKILTFLKSFISGLKGLSYSPKLFLTSIFLTSILWLAQCLAIYLTFKAFDQKVSITVIILGSVTIQLTHILPAAPGYLGSYEAFWTLIFSALKVAQTDLLLAMGVVSHLASTTATLVLGSIGTAWLGLSLQRILRLKKED